jgi:hypothetical protein
MLPLVVLVVVILAIVVSATRADLKMLRGRLASLEEQLARLQEGTSREPIARHQAGAAPTLPRGAEGAGPLPVVAAPVPATASSPAAAAGGSPVVRPRGAADAPAAHASGLRSAADADAAPEPVAAPAGPGERAAAASAADMSADGWEVVVGTNWLSKIGVFVFVIGVALLLGYSMAHVGPLGRVAVGFALSLGLLAAGVAIERRPDSRSYAHALIGGGWAGTYFTAYALHALPAARIIDSDVLAAMILVGVAAGMIVHSLRYRAQAVTAIAYVAAYAPLVFSPLSLFSLVALVPLTVSLLVVAGRFGWSGVSILGIAATYGIFAVRHAGPDGSGGRGLDQLMLWVFWATFEIADVASRRASTALRQAPQWLALNVLALAGTLLLVGPGPDAPWTFMVEVVAAAVVSAAMRAWLVPPEPAVRDGVPVSFGTVHAATALAAALFAWTVEHQFAGTARTIAFLLGTELLVGAGLLVRDPQFRRLGLAAAAVTTLQVWAGLPVSGVRGFATPETPGSVALIVAAVWYFNHELIRQRAAAVQPLETLYSWTGFLLIGAVLLREAHEPYRGLVLLTLAALLIETGLRRAREYAFQGYLALFGGALGVLSHFAPGWLAGTVSAREVWTVLPASTAIAYGLAARLARAAGTAQPLHGSSLIAGAASCAGTALLAVFEWHASPPVLRPLMWAGSAALAAAVGLRRPGLALLRWQGYALSGAAGLAALGSLAADPLTRAAAVVGASVVAILYGISWGTRRTDVRTAASGDELEQLGRIVVGMMATGLLLTLEARLVPDAAVAAAFAVTAAAIVGAGLGGRMADLRWQGYAILVITSSAVAGDIAGRGPVAASRAVSEAVVTAVLYASGVLVRRWIAPREPGPTAAGVERFAAAALLVIATLLAAAALDDQLNNRLVTLGWVVLGAAVLGAGFPLRERVLRLSGLGLLLLCILKLFAYDLRALEPLPRILSFVVLGLVLLAVSWVYTRFREQIRRLL